MNTIAKPDSSSQASIRTNKISRDRNNEIIRQKLRYEELDAEYLRTNRRLNRMVRNIKKGLGKKIF